MKYYGGVDSGPKTYQSDFGGVPIHDLDPWFLNPEPGLSSLVISSSSVSLCICQSILLPVVVTILWTAFMDYWTVCWIF